MKMKSQANKIYKGLKRKKNAIKIRAFLMAGLLLGINTFAWFTFVANSNGTFSADVISWDIQFFDDDSQVEILDVDLVDLYPGMDEFHKSIIVRNKSDLNAEFSYRIESVMIYGEEYEADDFIDSFLNDFPFTIKFQYLSDQLDIGESLSFNIDVNWPFEAENQYCKLNKLYPYLSGTNYYLLNGTNYQKTNINATSYNTALESGLYIECDDADTYWGERSVQFEKEHPDMSSITLKLKLIVSQRG